jgi:hypothetical protein
MTSERATENIKAFVSKYGEKGFLRLFFSNYLYEIVLSYVRAHSDTRSKDSGNTHAKLLPMEKWGFCTLLRKKPMQKPLDCKNFTEISLRFINLA